MNDNYEITLKNICCTCLSVDRNLKQLCRVKDGVNKLFFLLSYDSEAYEAMFHKDAINLHICWECNTLMNKLCKFRNQACIAQKQLTDIMDGKINLKTKTLCLSQLSNYHQTTYNKEYTQYDETLDNFIDCGVDMDFIKTESDTDELPLSDLQSPINNEPSLAKDIENTGTLLVEKKKNKIKKKEVLVGETEEVLIDSKYYTLSEMSDEEMMICMEKKKLMDSFVNAAHKCDFCVLVFNDSSEMEKHMKLHVKKQKLKQCDICKLYMKVGTLPEHRREHFSKYKCNSCDNVSYNIQDLAGHLEVDHKIDVEWAKTRKKVLQKPEAKFVRKKPRIVKTPQGYPCSECDQYFENKDRRYKHIRKVHSDGFGCPTCGKKFPYRFMVKKHEIVHSTNLPREQCSACGKLVRVDLRREHDRTHAPRPSHDCRACGKRFVSRATYVNHLKYAKEHAARDPLVYKCTMCEKGYRSRAELRDHVNYQHMGKTQHKCPICDKALATRRCVNRHVRRAHLAPRNTARDKICQTCGKAFKHQKSLKEHELIHSGEKPLACDECGRTFRQRAALYTHRRRVHGVVSTPRVVLHTDEGINV